MSMYLAEDISHQYSRIIQVTDTKSGLIAYIAIHQLFPGRPSFGATRYAMYPSTDSALSDATNLARLMTYKSVMADLPYGGAKAVILAKDPKRKKQMLLAYGRFVNQLQHEFITGADIGVSQKEVALMKTVAKQNMVGTQLDPVIFTAKGIVLALEETVRVYLKKPSLQGISFAIQGLGKVGEALLSAVYSQASKVYVTDVDQVCLKRIKKKYPRVVIVAPKKIYSVHVDFFCPCALSHSINEQTLSQLKCAVVLGGANIQLANPAIGTSLHKKGILYVPDYVVNAGGLISVTDEYENRRASAHRTEQKLKIIPKRVRAILVKSQKTGIATSTISDQMAEEIITRINSDRKN